MNKYYLFLSFTFILIVALGVDYILPVRLVKNVAFMDKTFTCWIKALAILSVFWSHYGASLGVEGLQFVAGIGVALFLICSGYGLEKSYQKNGIKYFWKKRLFKILSPYYVLAIVFAVVHNNITVKVLLSILLLQYGGYWFISYILLCYLIFWIIKMCGRFSRLKGMENAMFFVSFSLVFIFQSFKPYNAQVPFLIARQAYAFPFGVWFAIRQNEIIDFIKKNNRQYFFVSISCIACASSMLTSRVSGFDELPLMLSNVIYLLSCVPIAIGFLVMCHKLIRFIRSGAITWFIGTISYEFYLCNSSFYRFNNGRIDGMITVIVVTVLVSFVLWIVCEGRNKRRILLSDGNLKE